jgi:hypothetical protein
LRAYHGSEALKKQYVDRVRGAADADLLDPHALWCDRTRRGCLLGCAFEAHPHRVSAQKLVGLPGGLMYIVERVFTFLPDDARAAFSVSFFESPRVGADLRLVVPQLLHWILSDPESPAYAPIQRSKQREAVAANARLYRAWVETGVCPREDRWTARPAGNAHVFTALTSPGTEGLHTVGSGPALARALGGAMDLAGQTLEGAASRLDTREIIRHSWVCDPHRSGAVYQAVADKLIRLVAGA